MLLLPGAMGPACAQEAVRTVRPRPPFRVLYDNDLTNVTSVESPFHRTGEPFAIGKLHGSVDEIAGTGADVCLLQPGYGWVPCWKSRLYPYAPHVAWLMERYGTVPRFFGGYNAENITGEFVERCRKDGLAAFVSLRMNDYHHKNYVDFSREDFARYRDRINRKFELKVSRTYLEHPEYRLNDSPVPPRGSMDLWDYVEKYRDPIRRNNLWNWAIPEVRQSRLDLIREICEGYAIDGFELDFVRHPWLFRKEVPEPVRRDLMTGFVRQVRGILDATARGGRRTWLAARIPLRVSRQAQIGADVAAWFAAGVDLFTLAPEYRMEQQTDLARIHESSPEAPLYLELTHTTFSLRPGGTGTEPVRMMATPGHYTTAAHLAYRRGASGISLYNFAYHRWLGEPPFGVIRVLRDPDRVARLPQHYYLADLDNGGRSFARKLGDRLDETFTIDMAPPTGGWTTGGRLRIAIEPSHGSRSCRVTFNGVPLDETSDVSGPYPSAQPVDPGILRAWELPASLVKDGVNRIGILLSPGKGGELRFLDIGIR